MQHICGEMRQTRCTLGGSRVAGPGEGGNRCPCDENAFHPQGDPILSLLLLLSEKQVEPQQNREPKAELPNVTELGPG